MSLIRFKSRAKRILTFQLTLDMESPTFPAQVLKTRKRVTVEHEPRPVIVNGIEKRLPPSVTVLPGETFVLPAEALKLSSVKECLSQREIVQIKDTPKPAAKQAPTTPKRRRSAKARK